MATTYDADGKPETGYIRKHLAQRARELNVDPIVAEALDCFECSAEAFESTRKSIVAAKNFRALNQWPEQVREQRQGAPAIQGQAAQPARPCLTIDRVSGPTRQVSNMVKQSSFGFAVLANGEGADKDTADVLKGWMRRIQNDASADEPLEWAADSAAEGGLGWFKLCTDYCDDDPKFPFDQDVRLEKVKNSLSVYPDPFAQTWYPRLGTVDRGPRWFIQTEDFSIDQFATRWPKANQTTLKAFYATGDSGGWISDESVRVADFWKLEFDQVRVVEFEDGTAASGDIPSGKKIARERKRLEPKVTWYQVCATEVLDTTEWVGTRLPFVPIFGEELDVDGKTVLRGVIQPAMDPQRMLNYAYSAAIESAALAPKAPWLVAEGQTEAYKAIWQQAATSNYSVLPYKPVSLLGSAVPPPQRNIAEQPIKAFVELMSASEEAIKFTTNTFDPSLGNSNPRERSGTAIEALQEKSDFTQSTYLDNVKRAVTYAGDLLLELAPKILDRPGRVLQILGDGNAVQHVMLGQPFAPNAQGMPQPIMHQETGTPVTDPHIARLLNGAAKLHDPTTGRYGVTVTVGRDQTTRSQEEAAALGDLLPHLPPPMQAALTPEYIRNLDFSNSEEMAQIAERALPPDLQAAVNPPANMANVPPQIRAKLAQIPMLQQALQQAKTMLDTEQVKAQYQLQREQMVGWKEILLANVNNAAKILVAHITAAKEAGQAQDEARLEQASTGIQLWNDHLMEAQRQLHEYRLSHQEHQQTLAQNAQTHQQQLEQIAAQPQPAAPANGNGNGASA